MVLKCDATSCMYSILCGVFTVQAKLGHFLVNFLRSASGHDQLSNQAPCEGKIVNVFAYRRTNKTCEEKKLTPV